MRTDIHPAYGDVKIVCSCGNTFVTRSTRDGEQHIELCNECHPFFTGKQKLVDTGGPRRALQPALRQARRQVNPSGARRR